MDSDNVNDILAQELEKAGMMNLYAIIAIEISVLYATIAVKHTSYLMQII